MKKTVKSNFETKLHSFTELILHKDFFVHASAKSTNISSVSPITEGALSLQDAEDIQCHDYRDTHSGYRFGGTFWRC